MKIAISGSHGFLGSALIEQLEKHDHQIYRLVRANAKGNDILFDVEGQNVDTAKLNESMIDVVIHLAGEGIGEKKWSPAQKQKILTSRTQGTKLLADALAAIDNKPKLFISSSAIGFYGSRGDVVLDENSSKGDGFLSDVCSKWEEATKPASDAGIDLAIIRTGIVLDPNGGTLKRMILPFKLGLGGRLGSGKQFMSWITLNDWVRAIQYIVDHQLSGTYNLVAPCAVTNSQFTASLGKVLHRPTFLPTPLFPLKAIYSSELVEALLLGSQNVVPKALIEAGFDFETDTIKTALKSLQDQ